MPWLEEAVSFRNSDGLQLYGIVHRPHSESRNRGSGVGVVLVHSGIRGRLGTTRQYLKYSRILARNGYYAFRFDSYGMGDSEGTIEECNSKSYFRSIQTGRYVSDTECAIRFLKEEYGVKRIVLMGLCGGAITSLLTSARNSRIDGLILLNPPVMLDRETGDYLARRPCDYYKMGLTRYLAKMADPASIKRFLTGKADFQLMFFYLRGYFKKRIMEARNRKGDVNQGESWFNGLFWISLQRYTGKGPNPCLFIYGGNDYFKVEFEREVLTRCNGTLPKGVEYHVIPQANHMLTLPKWEDEAIQISVKMLERLADER